MVIYNDFLKWHASLNTSLLVGWGSSEGREVISKQLEDTSFTVATVPINHFNSET